MLNFSNTSILEFVTPVSKPQPQCFASRGSFAQRRRSTEAQSMKHGNVETDDGLSSSRRKISSPMEVMLLACREMRSQTFGLVTVDSYGRVEARQADKQHTRRTRLGTQK